MGAFFTNVHVRIPEGDASRTLDARLRALVERRLHADGLRPVEGDERPDRELVIVRGARWLAFYDARAEDQDETIEEWARELSEALATDAFSVLVHDSDVLVLALFARGKLRDRYDSNPAFSGKRPSKVTPAARAEKWAHLLAPKHRERDLAAVFERGSVLAEAALEPLASAIGADPAQLATGYRYLAHDVPAGALHLGFAYAKAPAWTKRSTAAPRFTSQWPAGEEPEPWVARVLAGQAAHVTAVVVNRGGAANGLRIEIATSASNVELVRAQVVIHKPGRFQMDASEAPLVRTGDRYAAELPDVALMPGFSGTPDAMADAPLDALMDAHHAGQVQLNLECIALAPGAAELRVTFTPLANPAGARTERVAIDVHEVRGAPLRATELGVDELERLNGDAHTYLLVLLDAPAAEVKRHALELLAGLRMAWPRRRWTTYASDDRFDLGDESSVSGRLADAKVWTTFARAIRRAKAFVTATSAPRKAYDADEAGGFHVDLSAELGAIAITVSARDVAPAAVEQLLVPAVDELARTGVLVQAVLVRVSSSLGPGTITAYESAVGLGDETALASRAWATRWLRAIGRGHLWLGRALRNRAPPIAGAELGPALRLAVTDVAATEQHLAALLPSVDDLVAARST